MGPLAARLLDQVRWCGAAVSIREDGGLRVQAPPGAMPPELLSAIRTHKAEILDLLREPANDPPAAADPPFQDVDRELRIVCEDLVAEARAAGVAKPIKYAAKVLKLKPSSVIRVLNGGRL